jgi:hypothetical protein
MTRLVLMIAAAVLLGSAIPAQAAPITYSLTTTASGTLGASSFTNALVTVTLSGDTSNIMPGSGSITGFLVNPGTATVGIAGVGTATFTGSIGILSTFNNVAVFGGSGIIIGQFVGPLNNPSDLTGILTQQGPAFFGYNLQGLFGPVSGTGGSSAPDPTARFPTTGGILNFTAPPAATGTTTFTAVPAFFTGQVSVGSGVEYLQFPNSTVFGYYTLVATSILYHYDMGYEAFIPGSASDVYLYDFTSGHWWYSSNTSFPYLYDFTLNAWLYYFPDTKNSGHYSTNPRSFSNLTTGQIFTM